MEIQRDPRTTARTAAIWLGGAALLFILWRASDVWLTLVGGLIAASIFAGLASLFERYLPISRRWSMALSILLLVSLLIGGFVFAGAAIALQFSEITTLLREQAKATMDVVSQYDLPGISKEDTAGGDVGAMLSDSGSIMGQADRFVFSAFGGLSTLLIIVFVGIFIATDPAPYRRGIVNLVPVQHRDVVDETIRDAAERLGLWLKAQGLSMLTIFFATWAALWFAGTPYAMPLALIAGLLTFVQTIGPAIAGIVILMVGLTADFQTALIGSVLYGVILTMEANVTTPLLQRRFTTIQPALVLMTQILFGALFGLMGLLFAVPLVAILLPFAEKLYVERALGGWYEGKGDGDD